MYRNFYIYTEFFKNCISDRCDSDRLQWPAAVWPSDQVMTKQALIWFNQNVFDLAYNMMLILPTV